MEKDNVARVFDVTIIKPVRKRFRIVGLYSPDQQEAHTQVGNAISKKLGVNIGDVVSIELISREATAC